MNSKILHSVGYPFLIVSDREMFPENGDIIWELFNRTRVEARTQHIWDMHYGIDWVNLFGLFQSSNDV